VIFSRRLFQCNERKDMRTSFITENFSNLNERNNNYLTLSGWAPVGPMLWQERRIASRRSLKYARDISNCLEHSRHTFLTTISFSC
jgi:hypothetical protein